MKKNFFSTRRVSVLVIISVFIFGGACTRQESNVTYFDNDIQEIPVEESSQEMIVEEIDEHTKVIKTKKENSELNEKEAKEDIEENETVEKRDESVQKSSSDVTIVVNTEEIKSTEDEEDNLDVLKEETKDISETEEKTTEEKVLDENIIESAKGDVTMADRAEATALAMKRLSAGELRSLIAMSRGGFTTDEKKEAIQLMREKFTVKEQEWILSKFYEYVGGN